MFKSLAQIGGDSPGKKLLRVWGWPEMDIRDLYDHPDWAPNHIGTATEPEVHKLPDNAGVYHTLWVWDDEEGTCHSWWPDPIDAARALSGARHAS